MGQALYRKYRPRTLNQTVGQTHVVKTLANALKLGRISHAYLFTGPRGVGKTSVARILAHEENKLPYSDDSVHLDIIEIDAASNRRIDEIRDLREKVHIAPTSAKYKVYIIDEVHMLTREAFNALLKTLEEPPPHCIFILATTEAHKLPETITSRTQRFTFKPIDTEEAAGHLQKLAKTEKIEITGEAIDLLAEHGSGSFRDSIGLLDQLASSNDKITADIVRASLGLPPERAVKAVLDAVAGGEAGRVIEIVNELKLQAVDPVHVALAISKRIRQTLLIPEADASQVTLLKNLIEVASSSQPYDLLEINLLEAALSNSRIVSAPVSDPSKTENPRPSDTSAETDKKTDQAKPATHDINRKKTTSGFSLDDWDGLIEKVKVEAASLYTALRLATPKLEDKSLTLAFAFPLHQKKVTTAKSKDLIGRLIEDAYGVKLAIECIVDKSLRPEIQVMTPVSEPAPNTKNDQSLETISNIFGSLEVLES